jgi:peptidylprolyl isomerase
MGKRSVLFTAILFSLLHAGCGGSDSPAGDGRDDDSSTPEEMADPPPANSGDDLVLPPPDDVAAPPADAERTASGLAWKQLVPGQGSQRPRATDRVRVHYKGWQTDGYNFDSSFKRGVPLELGVDRFIAGWIEALQLMVEGEQRRLWIPEELAYRGTPDYPSGMLVFDMELITILPP